MFSASTFQVYNASAGSGKTFTLVKEYLKVLLQSDDLFVFQKILAITFTNKAAREMKERVLKNLQAFADGEQTDMLPAILEETKLDLHTIKARSELILQAILQNYAAFGITTIDSFTHKIIKSFAFDLGLNMTFEVELDAKTLLAQAVDLLISKIGIDEKLTNLLIDFSIEKASEDKSWDISRELNEFASILLNESDAPHFKKLAEKSIINFIALKKSLINHQKDIEKRSKKIGNQGLEIIADELLEHSDFYRGMLPKHFSSLEESILKAKFFEQSKLRLRIEENTFYAKSKSEKIKAAIENILPDLLTLYKESEKLYQQHTLYKLALKSITPLAVLNHINYELNNIKQDHNIRLLAEFNQLISEAIKNQPAPFIYERIGQKLTHFFIDEMQDTSTLQWQNLIPLINNALAQENSSLLLVGDGKQAIYRWRGGKAEQFVSLGNSTQKTRESNPFQIEKSVKKLDTNRRSYSEIINFTNSFFQSVAAYIQNPSYQQLFIDGNKQNITDKIGGFVSIDFLEKDADTEQNKLKHPKRVLEIINQLDGKFSKGEICVLVRKKDQGVAVANYLSENGVQIVSSETLLLQNSSKVVFMVNMLQIFEYPEDENTKLALLYFLYSHLKIDLDKHLFFEKLIKKSNEDFFASLKEFGVDFNLQTTNQLPFYEKMEAIIRSFSLVTTADAYVQFFLDVIFEQQQKGLSIQEFLDFWEQKKDTLSISAAAAEEAVQIMTIHKAKGLEFPVVIFPYDINIYYQKNSKAWLKNLPKDIFVDFDELLVSSTKEIETINKTGAAIYQQQQEELELDNFNVLYVALTRAVEQLYVVTEKNLNKDGLANTKFTSGIFIEYLKQQNEWNDEKSHYIFGDETRRSALKEKENNSKIQDQFISNSWQNSNIYTVAKASKLWDTEQGKAIEFGNLIHEIASKIYTEKEVNSTIHQYYQQGILNKERALFIKERMLEVVNHPLLTSFYSKDVTVFNEREIVGKDGQIIIPDRLVFNSESQAIIIDYKTGKPEKEHHQQVLNYGIVLESMQFTVIKKVLIYINEAILVEEVS